MMKGKKSPFAAYVCTTPELIEADKPSLSCRVALSIDNMHETVPAPAHSGYPATVSANKKGGKSAK
jgi:hypothetical protein